MSNTTLKALSFTIGFIITIVPIALFLKSLYRGQKSRMKTTRSKWLAITVALALTFVYYWLLAFSYDFLERFFSIDSFFGALPGGCALMTFYIFFITGLVTLILYLLSGFKRILNSKS